MVRSEICDDCKDKETCVSSSLRNEIDIDECAIKKKVNPMQETRNKIIEELKILPEAIKKKEEYAVNLRDKIELNNITAKTMERVIADNVASMIDADGKKIYSNETKRRIETEKKLNEDQAYLILTKDNNELKREMDYETINVDFLRRRHRSALAMARLLAGDD